MNARSMGKDDLNGMIALAVEQDVDMPPAKCVLHGTTVTDDGGKPVAFGILFARCEGIMLIPGELNHKDKARAVRVLLAELLRLTTEEVVCFSHDQSFLDILVKHYGAEVVKPKAVVLNPRE